jgi:hypothetical protein
MRWLFGGLQASGADADPGARVVDAILSSTAPDQLHLYGQLPQFLPRSNSVVLAKLFPGMAQLLFKSADEQFKTLLVSILHTLLFDPASGQSAIDLYVTHPTFATSLLGNLVPFNEKVFDIIDRLFEIAPSKYHMFILAQPQSMQPMIHVITDTKNERAASSFHRMVSSNRAVVGLLADSIQASLRLFPISTAVDFLVLSERFRHHLPADEFEIWLLGYRTFRMSDVQRLVQLFPGLWERRSVLQLLARTEGMRGVDEIFWIHGLAPQNHALSPEVTDEIAHSLMNPSFEVSEGHDPSEPYAFVRLFGPSFANPTFDMNARQYRF